MYEVLDKDRMSLIKAKHVRERQHLPKVSGIRGVGRESRWGAMFLVSSGTAIERLQNLPCGSEIKVCLTDRSVWEILVPKEFKNNKELLAKRLDAIAFL